MRIQADLEWCEGHSSCVSALLDLSEDGTVLVWQSEVTPERSDEAADAVPSCPVAALRLIG
jgi:ferredoxin